MLSSHFAAAMIFSYWSMISTRTDNVDVFLLGPILGGFSSDLRKESWSYREGMLLTNDSMF